MIILNNVRAYLSRDNRLLLHLSVFLAGGFILLTALVYLLPPSFIDVEFSEEMQEHQNPLLDFAMRFVSWFGGGIVAPVMVGVTAFTFYVVNARREALFMVLTLLSAVVAYGLKVAVNRPRPTADLVTIIEQAKFQSFPSGHVLFYVTFFGFLTYLMYRSEWIWTWLRWSTASLSLLLLFSVPFSRVYLGAHWFTDVLAGFLVGLLCLIGLAKGYSSKNNSPSTTLS
jgi:undecaprenyl-diphosphatase